MIAYAAGGALETVIEGVTGRFFYQHSAAALAAAVAASRCDPYDATVIRQHAEGFGYPVFIERMRSFIDSVIHQHTLPFSCTITPESNGFR